MATARIGRGQGMSREPDRINTPTLAHYTREAISPRQGANSDITCVLGIPGLMRPRFLSAVLRAGASLPSIASLWPDDDTAPTPHAEETTPDILEEPLPRGEMYLDDFLINYLRVERQRRILALMSLHVKWPAGVPFPPQNCQEAEVEDRQAEENDGAARNNRYRQCWNCRGDGHEWRACTAVQARFCRACWQPGESKATFPECSPEWHIKFSQWKAGQGE